MPTDHSKKVSEAMKQYWTRRKAAQTVGGESSPTAPSPAAKGPLTCAHCNRTFRMPAHLARHMSVTHGLASARKRRRGPQKAVTAAASAPTRVVGTPTSIAAMSDRQLAGLRRAIDSEIIGRLVRGEASVT